MLPGCTHTSRRQRILLLALGLMTACAAVPVAMAVPEGFLDVTQAGADPTGTADSTTALQAAINQARDQNLVVWFPAGTYTISDRLLINQPDNDGDFPVVLMGSTTSPANRATIRLAANSPGFNNPSQRKVMVHFINRTVNDAPFNGFNETGNTDLYNQGVVGLDFVVESGNDGAVALRMQGAEGCTIQDVNIDLTAGGHTGIWGIPASGGSTHRVTVNGGRVGIDTRQISGSGGGSQPQPVVTGSTFRNQTEYAVRATARGSLVLVGCRIESNRAGPVIWLRQHWSGQPFDASLQLVDCSIDYATFSPLNTVIEMDSTLTGRSFLLDNCHVARAARVWHEDATANPDGWMHFRRLAVEIRPPALTWGQPEEQVMIDGQAQSGIHLDAVAGAAPPADLQTRHRWGNAFPTWETPGAVNVLHFGATGDGITDDWQALQAAIDAHEVLLLPKGRYRVSRPLELRPQSKLIGAWHKFTAIEAISSVSQRFGGATDATGDLPIIRTADNATADTILAFLQIRRLFPLAQHNPTPPGNYALEWRCGGTSLTRHVAVEALPSTNVRPDYIARLFYGYNTTDPSAPGHVSINPNHPQDSFRPGDWAWPCAEPNVQIRGNGGGRWFNFWVHGRQGLRAHVPFLRVEGTRQALQFYHLHLQQQDSLNHGEFLGASNVTIYGTKGEIKGSQLYFESCDNVRLFGHGGLSSPDPARNPPYLFRFINCSNFLVSGLGDTINDQSTRWVGGAYDRWIHANLLTWQPLLDAHEGRSDVIVPSNRRPILYQRGAPVGGAIVSQPPAAPPVTRIELPATGITVQRGTKIVFRGAAADVSDGNLAAVAVWTSSRDGVLGSGRTLETSALSDGEHTITFSVTNGRGRTSTSQVTLAIEPPADLPANTFTNASSANSALSNSGNWLNGSPNSRDKTGWLDLAGTFTVSSGGTGAVLTGHFIRQNRGTVQEAGNIALRGGEWTLDGGELRSTTGQLTVGNGGTSDAQRLAIRGGSVSSVGRFNVTAFSELVLEGGSLGGSEWLSVAGTLRLSGGAANFTNTAARLQTSSGGLVEITGGTHRFNTLRLQDGGPLRLGGDAAVLLESWDISTTGAWSINVTGGAPQLTVANQTPSWFAARYAAGRLLFQGSNTRPFGEVFVVSGSTLSVKPPPPNTPPHATITSPAPGAAFAPGQTVVFAGLATDAEDGDLSDQGLWDSSLDGPIGTGSLLTTAALRPGTHSITFEATDVNGLRGAVSIVINVRTAYAAWREANGLPTQSDAPDLNSDADGDRTPDALEYALGGDPRDPGSAPGVTITGDAGGVAIRFRRIADPALRYELWATEDLKEWGNGPIWASAGAGNVDGQVELRPDTGNSPSKFFQLRVVF